MTILVTDFAFDPSTVTDASIFEPVRSFARVDGIAADSVPLEAEWDNHGDELRRVEVGPYGVVRVLRHEPCGAFDFEYDGPLSEEQASSLAGAVISARYADDGCGVADTAADIEAFRAELEADRLDALDEFRQLARMEFGVAAEDDYAA